MNVAAQLPQADFPVDSSDRKCSTYGIGKAGPGVTGRWANDSGIRSLNGVLGKGYVRNETDIAPGNGHYVVCEFDDRFREMGKPTKSRARSQP
jgi:hypothetical protein